MESLLELLATNLQHIIPIVQDSQKANFTEENITDQNCYLSENKSQEDVKRNVLHLLEKLRLLLEPPVELLAENFLGYIHSKCLWTAVKFHIPDLLADGPKSVAELGNLAGAKPEKLHQVLRMLHNRGIFSYDHAKSTYSNNRASCLLLDNHWTRWKLWVDLYANEFYDMARGIPESVEAQSIRNPAQINYETDQNIIEYFASQNKLDRLLGTIGAGAIAQAPGIVRDYPWNEISDREGKLIDLGGGSGSFMASLLRSNPKLKGAVLDQKSVIDQFLPLFQAPDGMYADVADRCDLIKGDFFASVPANPYYTIKWCLHNWTDLQVSQILQVVRESIIEVPGCRLVVIEAIVTDGNEGKLSRFGDIIMMMASEGRERELREWKAVAAASGWMVHSITRLSAAWPHAIDLRPITPLSFCP